jgi:hypothetical protein
LNFLEIFGLADEGNGLEAGFAGNLVELNFLGI